MKTQNHKLLNLIAALFIVAFFSMQTAIAQPFYQLSTDILNEDETRSLQYTPFDGGHVTAGFSINDAGIKRMNLVKYDAAGLVLWDFLYDFGTDICWANAVELTSDGGYILAGATFSPLTGVINGALVKVDPFGIPMWSETYDYSSPYAELYSVEEIPSAAGVTRYVAAGSARNAFNGTLDAISLVVGPGGGIIFKGILDTGFDEEAYSIKPDLTTVGTISSYVITGYTTRGPIGSENILLAKLDPALGFTIWAQVIGGPGEERGRAVEILPSGEIGIAGHSNSYSNGKEDIYMGFFDPAGIKIWSNIYGHKGNEQAYSIEIMTDFTFAAAGWTDYKTGGSKDAVIIKAAIGTGALLYSSAFGGAGDEWGYSVKEEFLTEDVLMGGYCEGTAASSDDRNLFGVRTDFKLDSGCARILNYGNLPVLGCVFFNELLGTLGYSATLPVFPFMPAYDQKDKCCDCASMLVDFTPTTLTVCAGDVVTFTNTSVCVNQFRWFVNGVAVGPGPDLTYVFPAPGVYVIELGGRNNGCPIIIKSITVTVACVPPPRMEAPSSAISVSPNPASEELNISLLDTDLKGNGVMQLIDYTGKVVLSREIEIENGELYQQVEVNALAPGMYILSVYVEGQRQSKTVLISH
jgi:hypothetical protein